VKNIQRRFKILSEDLEVFLFSTYILYYLSFMAALVLVGWLFS